MLKRLIPKYTRIEWVLLSVMGLTLIVVPLAWPSSLAEVRTLTIITLFISLMSNAFFWQDPRFENKGYGVWLFFLIVGPIVAIVGYYMHSLYTVILTGIACGYAAPWSMLRVFLRRRFLLQPNGR